jgi:hypothetical protein
MNIPAASYCQLPTHASPQRGCWRGFQMVEFDNRILFCLRKVAVLGRTLVSPLSGRLNSSALNVKRSSPAFPASREPNGQLG